jgi:chemotaxis protein CheC
MQQPLTSAVSPRLAELLCTAVSYAGRQLTQLMEREIHMQGTLVESVPLEQLPSMLRGEDQLVTAVYLGFSGDCSGHVVLSFAPDKARQLTAILLMMPEAEEGALTEMEQSVLGEVGNITTSSFLNTVADTCGLVVHPSPPAVVEDMFGALLSNIVVALALEATHGLLLHTVIEVEGERLQGDLLLLPDAASCALLEERVA